MISHIAESVRKALGELPEPIRQQARDAYILFQRNPYHPSLHFKRVHPSKPIYSVRIDRDYRAVGIRDADTIVWFWIGKHSDYETLLSRF
jgi:mRNA-degrading endonuclease RelE of RelBE toxin-antitoxin system